LAASLSRLGNLIRPLLRTAFFPPPPPLWCANCDASILSGECPPCYKNILESIAQFLYRSIVFFSRYQSRGRSPFSFVAGSSLPDLSYFVFFPSAVRSRDVLSPPYNTRAPRQRPYGEVLSSPPSQAFTAPSLRNGTKPLLCCFALLGSAGDQQLPWRLASTDYLPNIVTDFLPTLPGPDWCSFQDKPVCSTLLTSLVVPFFHTPRTFFEATFSCSTSPLIPIFFFPPHFPTYVAGPFRQNLLVALRLYPRSPLPPPASPCTGFYHIFRLK